MPRFPPERPSADESSAEEEKFRELSGDEQEEIALHDGEDSVVERARTLVAKRSLLFTRPSDYFAENVNSDVRIEKRKEMTERLKSLKRITRELTATQFVERKGALEIAKAGGEEVDIAVEEATAPQNGPGKGVERRCRVAHQNAGSEEKAGDQNEIRGRLRLASSVEVARTTREKEP
ncbi:hypothetical protein EV401DRAFT_1893484 [Pisolithus croceorrhizus]|nr:hypothetical protein EV401DRAFT_1893484 [Pisolithus croceorrhizus]